MGISVALHRHPSSAGDCVRGLHGRARSGADGTIAFAFELEADLTRLRIPPPRPPAPADQLWRHTCFEAFVALDGEDAYRELNLSPSGEWAVYAFRGYRDRDPAVEGLGPVRIETRKADGRFLLDAVVHVERLRIAPRDHVLRLGLSAVIEALDGTTTHWAVRHPADRPDFHHREGLVLRLEPPGRPGY